MSFRFHFAFVMVALFAGALLASDVADTKDTDDAPKESSNKNTPPPTAKKKSSPFTLDIPLSDDPDEFVRLRFFGQHRTRYELRSPLTYVPTSSRQITTSTFNMRTRLGVDAQFPYSVGFLFEMQDVRLWGDEPRAGANRVNNSGFEGLDVLQAYLYTDNLFDAGIQGWVGRQKFTVGNQRLISTLEWAAPSRTWDGFRAQRSFMDKQITVMGLAMLVNELARVQDDEWMAGASLKWTPTFLKKSEAELFLLYMNRDAIAGDQDGHVATASLRWNGYHDLAHDESMAIQYTLEGIAQFGTADSAYWGTPGEDSSDVLAFGAAATVDFLLNIDQHSFRFGFEWDYASGDSDPTDDDFQTFRSPFPFGHKYHGFADQVGWRNLHDLSLVATWTMKNPLDIVDSLTVLIQGHTFLRENDDDAWYSPGGTVIRGGSPNESDQIGHEFDMVIKVKVNRWITAEVGWAHFFAGRFIKETATGSGLNTDNEESDMDFVWAQITLKF